MPRNRIIYQSEALYAGPAPATGFHYGTFTPGIGGNSNVPQASTNLVKQLQRVQTANYSFTVDRTDVNQFGQLAAIDRVILTNPTVALDFSYILANFANENRLGFTISSGNQAEVSAISGILNSTQDERNYFIRTVPDGDDAVGFNNSNNVNGVIGIGNGFISSYSTEGSVGNFPTVTVNVEGLNMNFQKGTSGNYIPAVNPADGTELTSVNYQLDMAQANSALGSSVSGISALRPGDITLSIPQAGGGAETSTMNVQSYTLSFDLARTPIERLGSKFAFSRPIDFPLTVSLSVDAQVTNTVTGSIASLVCSDSTTYTPTITIKNPACGNDQVVAQYKLKGAKLDSQEFSSDIGANKTVTLNFSTQIGGAQDNNNGLFLSGLY